MFWEEVLQGLGVTVPFLSTCPIIKIIWQPHHFYLLSHLFGVDFLTWWQRELFFFYIVSCWKQEKNAEVIQFFLFPKLAYILKFMKVKIEKWKKGWEIIASPCIWAYKTFIFLFQIILCFGNVQKFKIFGILYNNIHCNIHQDNNNNKYSVLTILGSKSWLSCRIGTDIRIYPEHQTR